ncbi:unnamed protein product [Rotaria sordida]|uniref:RING-type domain-containing protein n=1 Tax=Rotaria sordida TaxID=392033 RepID=A0A815KA75_9BILA|nr:unnamed protein product [Rotaria sordida]CAF3971344.1 unnamed protein product [Rotaria sordida]
MNHMTINDKYDYINEDSISECLKCKICSNPFIDPVKTKCKPKEHVFCSHCIKEWLQRDLSCPSCRQNVKIRDLTPITERIFVDVLNELPVKCLLCKQKGLERGDFDEHASETCIKRTSLCSSADIQCPWTGPYEELDKHLKTCPYTALRTMLIQIMANNRELTKQVNQQQIYIDRLQKENQEMKEQLPRQKVQTSNLPNCYRPPRRPQTRENTAKPPFQATHSSAPKLPCDNCPDCWRGAVRGSYFRGQLGGGFRPGHTMTPCDCDCHK